MPDTGAFLLLGLSVVTVIMGGLILSMVVRTRNLQRDEQTLAQIAQDDHGV